MKTVVFFAFWLAHANVDGPDRDDHLAVAPLGEEWPGELRALYPSEHQRRRADRVGVV